MSSGSIIDTSVIYISRTNKQGEFIINNIQEGQYDLTAIYELNKNLTIDNEGELWGFLDSVLTIPTEKEYTINIYIPIYN